MAPSGQLPNRKRPGVEILNTWISSILTSETSSLQAFNHPIAVRTLARIRPYPPGRDLSASLPRYFTFADIHAHGISMIGIGGFRRPWWRQIYQKLLINYFVILNAFTFAAASSSAESMVAPSLRTLWMAVRAARETCGYFAPPSSGRARAVSI